MWLPAPDESTWVGLLRLSLYVPGARSLKDKRKAVMQVKERLKARHGLAVAEVGHLDDRNRSVLAICTVGNDARLLRSVLDGARSDVESWSLALVQGAALDIHRPPDDDRHGLLDNADDDEDWPDYGGPHG